MEENRETIGGVTIYNVKTEIFSGPFDVLLHLIERRKLFINDIALAQVADDFITYIKSRDHFPLQESAHFILVASTLILIKSRSLLPSLSLTEEEEEGIEDLEKRLAIYKSVKEETLSLKEAWGIERLFFGSGEVMPKLISFIPDESITRESLALVAHDIIDRLPTDSVIPEVRVSDVVKLENVINSLIRRVDAEMKISFKSFSGLDKEEISKKDKYMVIVSFIAVLELVKQGILTAHQQNEDKDIYIENNDIRVPNYT